MKCPLGDGDLAVGEFINSLDFGVFRGMLRKRYALKDRQIIQWVRHSWADFFQLAGGMQGDWRRR